MNKISSLLVTLLALCWFSSIGVAQDDTYPNPTPRFLTLPAQPQILVPATNLPQWNGSFKDLTGTVRNFTMVGPSPLKNNGTTTIPVFLIPIKMVYGKHNGNMTFDPNKAEFQGTHRSVTKTILASPIFRSEIDFKQGGTDLGKTQYIDAFQRGTFWGEAVKKHNKYHVLLAKPRILPEQSIHVPPTEGRVGTEYGKTVGFMDSIAFSTIVQTYLSKFVQIQPDTLPIFLTYDVYLTSGGCCVGGYHTSYGGPPGGQTYVWSTTIDQGTGVFSQDTDTLSHEIGEWMDDPFVDNEVGCTGTGLLEVGDPLGGDDHPYTVDGFTYHLQDLVFLPYFGAPRTTSLHGWYSFQNDEKGVCPGQP
jgi:hypothetical protein